MVVLDCLNTVIEEGQEIKTAKDFLREYEDYVDLGRGEDKEYVEWYRSIVEHAEKREFPIAFEEFFDADHWRFSNGEALHYPPFTPASIDQLNDNQIIFLAKCVFDEGSVDELNDFF